MALEVIIITEVMPQASIKTYLPHSIFASFFFFPFGIIALVFSIMAEVTKKEEPQRAKAYAVRAAYWGMMALGLWLALLAATFAFVLFFRGSGWL